MRHGCGRWLGKLGALQADTAAWAAWQQELTEQVSERVGAALPALLAKSDAKHIAVALLAAVWSAHQSPSEEKRRTEEELLKDARLWGLLDGGGDGASGSAGSDADQKFKAELEEALSLEDVAGRTPLALEELGFASLCEAWSRVELEGLEFLDSMDPRDEGKGRCGALQGLMRQVAGCVEVGLEGEAQGPVQQMLRSLQQGLVAAAAAEMRDVYGDMLGQPAEFFQAGPKEEMLALLRAKLH